MLSWKWTHSVGISGLAVLAVAVVATASWAATAGSDTRVTTHDIITTDPFGSATPPTDVLQQNEPSIAVHPANAKVIRASGLSRAVSERVHLPLSTLGLGSPTPNRIGPGLGTLPQGRLRFDRPTWVALCRCGASAYKPYRDASHRRIDFRAVPEEVETLR